MRRLLCVMDPGTSASVDHGGGSASSGCGKSRLPYNSEMDRLYTIHARLMYVACNFCLQDHAFIRETVSELVSLAPE